MGRFSLRTLLLGGPTAVAIAVVAIVCSSWLRSMEEPCRADLKDDPVLLGKDTNVDPCHCFSETYQEARSKFLEATKLHPQAELHSYKVHEDYATDLCVLPGKLPGLVVHTSGVHGVEAYAGSAIQIAWLETSSNQRQDRPTLVFVHAVNPYGMAHYRRFDQSNVDLNRNALHAWDDEALQTKLKRNSKLYQEFDESLFYPRRPPTWFDLHVGFLWHAVAAIVRHGYGKLKSAMVTGQYNVPQGLFYGGSKLQPSHELLYNFVKDTVLPSMGEELAGRPVTWIDVHTGLGKIQGMDTLLFFADNDKQRSNLARQFVNASIQDESVVAGYESVLGTTDGFYAALFDNQDNVWMLGQEFGTIPSIAVAKALVLENMAHQYSNDENKPQVWSDLLRRAFYPHTRVFRKSVLQRGWTVLEQAIQRSQM